MTLPPVSAAERARRRAQQAIINAHADRLDPLGPPLASCPVCGAVGFPERIDDHDCQAFLEDR